MVFGEDVVVWLMYHKRRIFPILDFRSSRGVKPKVAGQAMEFRERDLGCRREGTRDQHWVAKRLPDALWPVPLSCGTRLLSPIASGLFCPARL